MKLRSMLKRIGRSIGDKNRAKYFKNRITALTNKDFSIISSFCIGGEVYHDLHMRFDSPTINLCFKGDDFYDFATNLKQYVECDIVETTRSEGDYPTGLLLGEKVGLRNLTVVFVHYPDFEHAKVKWIERRKRIHFDNIYIMADKFGCTQETIDRFEALPYKNKMLYSDVAFPGHPDVFVPSCYTKKNHKGVRGEISFFKGLSGLRYTDEFDWISFLNHPQ